MNISRDTFQYFSLYISRVIEISRKRLRIALDR